MQPRARGYRFGDVLVDAVAFRVERCGRALGLEPKAVDVLLYLLERNGQLVAKDELIAAVWRDVAVTDNALTRLIAQLRRELGDDAQQARYIETVKTRGYRFIATAQPFAESRSSTARVLWSVAPRTALASLALIVTTVALLPGVRKWTAADTPRAALRSVAVLPLEAAGEAETFFADGVTQGIHQALSELGTPAITGLTSSLRFRNATSDPVSAAAQLGVDGVLTGRIERRGEWIALHVSLVSGATGDGLWAGSYERPLTSAPALYVEVARALASSIDPERRDDVLERRPRRVEAAAYQQYLRGAYFHTQRWMAGGCIAAEQYLKNAIQLDPGFAPAYAALAWCYAYPDRTGRDIAEVGPSAKHLVSTALKLDDRLALAHAVLASIKWRVDYDPEAARREFETALALDRNSGLVRIPFAELLLWHYGRRADGLALLRPVIDLDPFSPDRHVQVGYVLMTVGEDAQALALFRKALELDPQYGAARLWLAETLAYMGRRDEAVEEYLRWLEVALRRDIAPEVCRRLEQVYRRRGWEAFWRQELDLVSNTANAARDVWAAPYRRYIGSYSLARRYAHMGERDKALAALEDAYELRHHQMATVPIDRLFAPFRYDVRFQSLMRKMFVRDPSVSTVAVKSQPHSMTPTTQEFPY